jgi:hypothetical protein
MQCDNGREFDNSVSRAFFLAKGVSLRMSCPYTSQQNGKAERMLRTTNNVTRTLLFQASMPPSYWADALATATHLINRLPTKTLNMSTPFFALYGTHPSYHDLRAFGCTCYPISPPPLLTNLPRAHLYAFSLATLPITRVTGASTSPQTVSSSLATLFSTKQRSLSHFAGPHRLHTNWIF